MRRESQYTSVYVVAHYGVTPYCNINYHHVSSYNHASLLRYRGGPFKEYVCPIYPIFYPLPLREKHNFYTLLALISPALIGVILRFFAVTFSQGDSFRQDLFRQRPKNFAIKTGKIRANKVVFTFKADSHITAMYCKMPALGVKVPIRLTIVRQ